MWTFTPDFLSCRSCTHVQVYLCSHFFINNFWIINFVTLFYIFLKKTWKNICQMPPNSCRWVHSLRSWSWQGANTVRWGKSIYRASSGFPPGNNLEWAGAVRPWLSFMCQSCFGVLFCNHMWMLVKRSKHFVPTQQRWLSQLIQGRRGAEALAMPGSSNIIILWYKDTNGKKPRPNAQRILSATKDISIQTVNS